MGNFAAGLGTGGKGGTGQGGTGNGGTTPTGGSAGSAVGGSDTGGSDTGGSSGAGASTGGSMAGAGQGGAMGGAGRGGSGGTTAGAGMGGRGGSGGTMAGAGQGGTMAGAGQGGTTAGAGMGGAGKGGSGGTGGSSMPGVLVHRYSFSGTNTTATDSVGTAHGTIMGGTQANGVVTLTGGTSDQYVQLPSNLLDGLGNATFEFWASWTGGTNNWQRVFDFGNSDAGGGAQGTTNSASPYIFFTPRAQATTNPNCTNATASMPRVAITSAGPMAEDCAFGTAAFPMTALTHVAVVLSGTNLTLYIGGAAVGTPATLNTSLAAVSGYQNNWLGRSQFSSDTEYAGTISEFRIYNTARSSSQISASATAGPDTAPTQ